MFVWTCTVHKVQGLSLSKLAVKLSIIKAMKISYGQIHVPLSRVTPLEGLYILTSFNVKSIRANPQAFEEYKRLGSECMLLTPNIEGVYINSLVITLFNIRAFNKQPMDLESGRRLVNKDIICLTETQLQQSLNSQRILTLANFHIICNNNEHRLPSLAICSRPEIVISSHTEANGPSLVTFVKVSLTSQTVKLLLLFKKHTLA